MDTSSNRPRQHTLDLLWSLWAELGVSGWSRRHQNWCIDPEPLIFFTATHGDLDPRLRDESTDWCIRYGRFISAVRLKALLKKATPAAQQAFGEYAATVAAHSGLRWPGATEVRPHRPSAKSQVETFSSASQLALRLRALLGVGARAEILRALLTWPCGDPAISAAALTSVVLYSKRNVLEELESLRMAGTLHVSAAGNRHIYRLQHPKALAALLGPLPSVCPNWIALFAVLEALLGLAAKEPGVDSVVRAVEANGVMQRRKADLAAMTPSLHSVWPAPPSSPANGGPLAWLASFDAWAIAFTEALATGRAAPS